MVMEVQGSMSNTIPQTIPPTQPTYQSYQSNSSTSQIYPISAYSCLPPQPIYQVNPITSSPYTISRSIPPQPIISNPKLSPNSYPFATFDKGNLSYSSSISIFYPSPTYPSLPASIPPFLLCPHPNPHIFITPPSPPSIIQFPCTTILIFHLIIILYLIQISLIILILHLIPQALILISHLIIYLHIVLILTNHKSLHQNSHYPHPPGPFFIKFPKDY